jgi:hypothetical protein
VMNRRIAPAKISSVIKPAGSEATVRKALMAQTSMPCRWLPLRKV